MQRRAIFFIFVASSAVITAFVAFSGYSLWGPSEAIRSRLLRLSPLGSDISQVEKVLEQKKISHEWRNTGFIPRGRSLSGVIGAKSCKVHLGGYRMILATSVDADYAFDSDGKLIELRVNKEVDGL